MRTPTRHRQAGFSILETAIATGILAGALAALGQMFAIAVASNRSARAASYAAVLAEQKMEQLRGLTWALDPVGLPASDTSSRLDAAVPTADGTGLSPSPSGTLAANVAGYVDYLDQACRSLGGGATPAPGTAYVRRWSIEPLPANPDDALILQVLVFRPGNRVPSTDEARLITIKTRKAP